MDIYTFMRAKVKHTARAEKQRREFGEWIRSHREHLGFNQAEAGRRAGMSRTQWTRLENGESGTRRENIPEIAKAVKADLHETYRRAGFVPPSEEVYLPACIEYFNELPEHVQKVVAIQIEALWKEYKREPSGVITT
jgi:transcriptional regulator with XRE-family HTH domain